MAPRSMMGRSRRRGLPIATSLIGRFAAIAVLTLSLAACGSSTSSSPVATTTVNLPPSYRFDPASIVVKAGDTVTWTNHDNFSHTVQFLDGGLPSDPMALPVGGSATFTFATPGTYHYQCSLHPTNMKGTVQVTG